MSRLSQGFSNLSLTSSLSREAQADLNRQHQRWGDTLDRARAGNQAQVGPHFPIILPPDDSEKQSWKCLQYEALPTETSIRLIRILPLPSLPHTLTALHDPIVCQIITVDLADKPAYTALSYCWGDPQNLFPFRDLHRPAKAWAAPAFEIRVLNNETDSQPISVSANLYAALLSLRYLVTEKAFGVNDYTDAAACPCDNFWIDAICIDQLNNTEKTSQVAMMHRIYKQATMVNVWLGGSDPASDIFVLIMNRLVKLFIAHNQQPGELASLRHMRIADEDMYKKLNKTVDGYSFDFSPITTGEWLSVFAFFSRSWFSRAWVVQELAFANKAFALCGTSLLDIDELVIIQNGLRHTNWGTQLQALAVYYIDPEPHIHDEVMERRLPKSNVPRLFRPSGSTWGAMDTLVEIFNVAFGLGRTSHFLWKEGVWGHERRTDCHPHTLMEAMGIFHNSKATDPRDKVFAFFGVSEEFVDGAVVSGFVTVKADYSYTVREVFTQTTVFCLHMRNGLEILERNGPQTEENAHNLPSWVPDFSSPAPFNGRMPWSAIDAGKAEFKVNLQQGILNIRAIRIGTVTSTFKYGSDVDLILLSEFLKPFCAELAYPVPFWDAANRAQWQNLRWNLPAPRPKGSIDIHSRWQVLWRTQVRNNTNPHYPADEAEATMMLRSLEKCLLQEMLKFLDWYGRELEENKARLTAVIDFSGRRTTPPLSKILYTNMLNETWKERMKQEFPARAKTMTKSIEALQHIVGDLRNDGQFKYIHEFRADVASHTVRNQHPISSIFNFVDIISSRIQTITGEGLDTRPSKMLIQTSTNLMGNAPLATKAGDEIWLIPGLRSPAILRKAEKSMLERLLSRGLEYDFAFLGAAYIHGIMHGEATEGVKDEDFCEIRLI
ncbi:hypothetical protein EJ05DRAFT_395113 [Pseudovirgaria hyperparasitica]|uniref:Heterokaryon incompatibility domain-containing protein n=1 Tax=Pseudovirgaria hyperparasitica TaxID=470096 RepID=A0A6A6W6F0_9PEZI|nr:uncharacterized protein EJ05DRAFT_395113 [Pseudovirgaria hyperparasitica]KAF2757604.1 hypothetical protein EJ05DRAFT_395113 [Pseudovirgaria hyperparasitica]